ncbi:MAG: 50S ribosomal protein L11 methyltransferase [Beijerinckiaceae bacterium]
MREGLIPSTVTTVMRLDTTGAEAKAITELAGEVFDPDETGVASFEDQDTQLWHIEIYFAHEPDEEAVRDLIASVAGEKAAATATFDSLAAKDWVNASLDGLKPVEAGRFIIHGSHDRAVARRQTNRITIEIEAALAFGTGHHGTTHGCLARLDHILKMRRPTRVLDVGTGTGVLAIAAARVLHQPVVATDIDPVAIEVAKDNAKANHAAAYMRFAVAPGLRHRTITRHGPYDLIMANILAGPLRALAPGLCRQLLPWGDLILSGLLVRDVPGVLAAYRANGVALNALTEREGWVMLHMKKGGTGSRPYRPF